MAACSGSDVTTTIDDAEQAAATGKFDRALQICAPLDKDSTALTATQMCRLSMIYALAADSDIDRESNIANAERWLDFAMRTNGDSVQQYLSSLSPEQLAIILPIQQLNTSRGYDFSNIEDEPLELVDSLETEHTHD